jgi:hypothetical protein
VQIRGKGANVPVVSARKVCFGLSLIFSRIYRAGCLVKANFSDL